MARVAVPTALRSSQAVTPSMKTSEPSAIQKPMLRRSSGSTALSAISEVPVSPCTSGSSMTRMRITSAITQVAMANSPSLRRSTKNDRPQATTAAPIAPANSAG
jgi:hypothetical protein